MVSGIFIPDVDTRVNANKYSYRYVTIPHTLGKIPTAVYVGWIPELNGQTEHYIAPEDNPNNRINMFRSAVGLISDSEGKINGRVLVGSREATRWYEISSNDYSSPEQGMDSDQGASFPLLRADESNIYVSAQDSTQVYFIAGQKYLWIAG